MNENEVKKAGGKSVHIPSALNAPALVNIYGESTQDGTPTTDNKVDIKSSVVKEIKICKKNLINQVCVTASEAKKHFLNAGTYTVSKDKSEVGKNWYIGAYDKHGNIITADAIVIKDGQNYGLSSTNEYYYGGTNQKAVTFTVKKDCYVRIGSLSGSGNTYLMLEVGIVASEYEPYTETVYTLPEPITLNGLNGVQDYIYVKRGVLVQKFNEQTLDGSSDEAWSTLVTNDGTSQRLVLKGLPIKPTANNSEIPNILCNQFLPKSATETYVKVEGINVNTAGVVYIYSDDFNTSDVSLWRAHLASKPMKVIYELAEPIETPLPEADLEALRNIMTYEGVNNISNDANALMSVLYASTEGAGITLENNKELQEVAEDLSAHTSNKSNPHGVTKEQVGLGNVDNTADINKSVKYAVSAGTLKDLTASVTELNHMKGVKSSVQTQLNKCLQIVSFDGTTGTLVTKSADYTG